MNKKALHKLSYGLYIVSSRDGEKRSGQIANTVFQVTSEPPRIAIGINKNNLTHEVIQRSGVFGVSALSQDAPLSFIGRFGFKSGREVDKFDGANSKVGKVGIPLVLDHALAILEARVSQAVDLGTHTLFVGEVEEAEVLREGEPMTYAYYHQVKRGTTPKTAPSYIEERKEAIPKLAKYKCSVCGYVYDPEKGDPESGIAPGTPFEELPEDWVCPVCGAGKDEFEKE